MKELIRMELEWMEPPVSGNLRRKSRAGEITELLQQTPGKWARVEKAMKSPGGQSKWKRLGCEAVSRANENIPERFDVFARWPEPAAKKQKPTPAVVPVAKTPKEKAVSAPPKASADRLAANHSALPAPVEVAAKTSLNPDDPHDQYLARQRAQLEAERKARTDRAARLEKVRSAAK